MELLFCLTILVITKLIHLTIFCRVNVRFIKSEIPIHYNEPKQDDIFYQIFMMTIILNILTQNPLLHYFLA